MSNENGDVYIGSTIQTLKRRLNGHKTDYNRYLKNKFRCISVFDIIKLGNYEIVLIEDYKCNSKKELEKREGYYIETMNCINKRVAGGKIKIKKVKPPKQTKAEKKIYLQNYYIRNKDKINKRNTEWRNKNKKHCKDQYKIKYTCACGSVINKRDKSHHEKRTKKHQLYISTLSDTILIDKTQP